MENAVQCVLCVLLGMCYPELNCGQEPGVHNREIKCSDGLQAQVQEGLKHGTPLDSPRGGLLNRGPKMAQTQGQTPQPAHTTPAHGQRSI